MTAASVRYARLDGGQRVAYRVAGSGPAVVFVPGTLAGSNLTEQPTAVARFGLADQFTVVTYDQLGSGLSDREGYDFSLDGLVRELEAVIDASGVDQFTLVGVATSCAVAALYSVRHPERVARLVMAAGWVRGADYVHSDRFQSYRRTLEGDWSMATESMARVIWGAALEDAESLAADIREAVSQETYLEFLDAIADHDGSEAMSAVTVPTLVTHSDGLPVHQREFSRDVAATIPNAELLEHVPSGFDYLRPYIAGAAQQPIAGGFSTILFTDVVSSTPLLSQLKDNRMRAVMRDHDAVCEAAITEHGGRVVKTIGDAFMAEFSVPSAAIEAAIAIQRGVREQFADSDVPIRLRIGINAGEPIVEDDDLHGASVVIAKRLESEADGGGILVSDVVRQAVAGKDFEFEDRGEVELKGFDQPVRAWAARWDQ